MASTVIGSSITIDGEISGDDQLVVHGTIKGRISVRDALVVENGGVV
jgi:cytoskeletal protein CcmA (bactofilin family)